MIYEILIGVESASTGFLFQSALIYHHSMRAVIKRIAEAGHRLTAGSLKVPKDKGNTVNTRYRLTLGTPKMCACNVVVSETH